PAVSATARSSGHHRSSTYTRVCWAQPTGESQDRKPPPTSIASPAARSRYATAKAAPASPPAPRPYSVIWAVTAVTAANTTPTAARAAPYSQELGQVMVSIPTAPRPSAVTTPSATLAPPTTTSAATVWACRP